MHFEMPEDCAIFNNSIKSNSNMLPSEKTPGHKNILCFRSEFVGNYQVLEMSRNETILKN